MAFLVTVKDDGENRHAEVTPVPTRNDVIARIKRALQTRSGKTWSVTGGRGTAYGWIKIDVPPARHTWHFVDSGRKDGSGFPVYDEREDRSKPFGHASPAEREELGKLLGFEETKIHHQGHSIPSGSAYYREYIDRAEGRTPSVIGTPYWD